MAITVLSIIDDKDRGFPKKCSVYTIKSGSVIQNLTTSYLSAAAVGVVTPRSHCFFLPVSASF